MSSPTSNQSESTGKSMSTGSLRRHVTGRAIWEALVQGILACCAGLSVLVTGTIILILFTAAVWNPTGEPAFFQRVALKDFLFDLQWTPQFDNPRFGILPLLCGTIHITMISAILGLPVGLASAIYLSEYASPWVKRLLKPTLELLAGIPTVVYGYLALTFLTPFVLKPLLQTGFELDPSQYGWLFWVCPWFLEPLLGTGFGVTVDEFNSLSGGIVVAIMIIPTVCSMSEDVISAVPVSLREAAYALGSTKFDVIVRVVVPSALSGIMASFLLAISRAVGETMAVTMAAGNFPNLTINPLRMIQTMTGFIVNAMKGDASPGSLEYVSLYAVALVLFLCTLTMNLISNMILRRYREVYQ